jgi:hypothetical protein
MKRKTEPRIDDLVNRIGELARGMQDLARVAVKQYSAEVEAILTTQIRDSKHIERCIDGMLDFCFDDEMLVLYKKLCRYYYNIDPEVTVSYVNFYREMWDEQKPDKRAKLSPKKKEASRGQRGNLQIGEMGTKGAKGANWFLPKVKGPQKGHLGHKGDIKATMRTFLIVS